MTTRIRWEAVAASPLPARLADYYRPSGARGRYQSVPDATPSAAYRGYAGTCDAAIFVIYTPGRVQEWVLRSDLPGQDHWRAAKPGPDELKATAEQWLTDFAASIGPVFDLASTFPPEVSACRFCNALLRQSQDGLYADIDLNEVRNPEPWQCSGRYVASPGGRHKPMLESGTASQERTDGQGQHPAAIIVRCDELGEGDRLLDSDAMVTVLRVDTYDDHLGISVWDEEGRRWYLDRQPSSLVAVCRASQERTGDGEPRHA